MIEDRQTKVKLSDTLSQINTSLADMAYQISVPDGGAFLDKFYSFGKDGGAFKDSSTGIKLDGGAF
jgi:hypothetical protein